MDNFYTSIPLAYRLIDRQTHLVGTLRSNRKYICEEVKQKKLKKGEIISKETSDGLTVVKWRDQRDVLMLTTRHLGNEIKPVQVRQKVIQKPSCVLEYDQGKFSVDVSDQLASYNTALRRCTKWYRKLLIEVIWGTCSVNANYLYNMSSVNQRTLTMTDFKLSVIQSLLESGSSNDNTTPNRRQPTHHLIQHPTKKRARCCECYKRYGKHGVVIEGKKKLSSLVWNICDTCEGQPHYCKSCFNETH